LVIPPQSLYPSAAGAAAGEGVEGGGDSAADASSLDSFGNCTDVLLTTPGVGTPQFLGHNEDGGPDEEGNCYLLDATVYADDRRERVEERFTAFCYAGLVGGTAFGWNEDLLFTNNAVVAREANMEKGLPRFFVNRAILAAKSVGDALRILADHLPATAFNVNLCPLKVPPPPLGASPPSSFPPPTSASVECHPFAGCALHWHHADVGGLYFRSNHYLHHSVDKCFVTPSSRCRLEAVRAFVPTPTEEEGVRRCLSICTGGEAPVYWKHGGEHVTHCTVVVEFKEGTGNSIVSIYDDKPDVSEPVYVAMI
jgi:hypothetical protein